jgi:site-specific DNA recombinase
VNDATKRRRFIEYARVSKVGDRDDNLISPDIQRDAMDAYAARHNIEVIDRVVDLDRSGRTFERRQIKRIIQRIERGEADGVLLWKWSRWGRNVERSKYYLRKVALAGGEVKAATEDIDTKTAIGRLQLTIQQGIDQYHSDQASEIWRAVQSRRRELQLPAGGAAPLGYRSVPRAKGERNDKPPVPDREYGPVVREMYELFLRGTGPQGIAKVFNERGLTLPRSGGPFSVSTVTRVLDSGFAAGLLDVHDPKCDCAIDDVTSRRTCHPPNRVKIRGAHEALIDQETWTRYQAERDRRRRVRPQVRQPKWFLGAGLAVCGRCGGHMIVDSYGSAKSQAICAAYRNRPGTCDGSWIDRRKLETLVALWLGGHIDEWANAAEATRDVDDERAQLTKVIDAERAQEAKVRDGLSRASLLVGSGDMTDEDYRAAKANADAQLRELQDRLADLQSQLDALDPAGDAYERLSRALGRSDGTHTVTQPVNVALDEDTDARVQAVIAAGREHGVPEDVIAEATTEQVPAMTPEEWHALLRRIIRRVVIEERHIVIEPWVGDATRYDRARMMPPRKRTDVQARDAKSGRFVKQGRGAK